MEIIDGNYIWELYMENDIIYALEAWGNQPVHAPLEGIGKAMCSQAWPEIFDMKGPGLGPHRPPERNLPERTHMKNHIMVFFCFFCLLKQLMSTQTNKARGMHHGLCQCPASLSNPRISRIVPARRTTSWSSITGPRSRNSN
jgi:hypothetical protein